MDRCLHTADAGGRDACLHETEQVLCCLFQSDIDASPRPLLEIFHYDATESQAVDFSEALQSKIMAGNDTLREELAVEHAEAVGLGSVSRENLVSFACSSHWFGVPQSLTHLEGSIRSQWKWAVN